MGIGFFSHIAKSELIHPFKYWKKVVCDTTFKKIVGSAQYRQIFDVYDNDHSLNRSPQAPPGNTKLYNAVRAVPFEFVVDAPLLMKMWSLFQDYKSWVEILKRL